MRGRSRIVTVVFVASSTGDKTLSSGEYLTRSHVLSGGRRRINSKDRGNDLMSPSPVRPFGSRHCKKKQAGCLLRGLLADLK